jgi:hypothetical protein
MWIRKGVVTTKRAHNELRAITPKSSARFHSGAVFCPAPDGLDCQEASESLSGRFEEQEVITSAAEGRAEEGRAVPGVAFGDDDARA